MTEDLAVVPMAISSRINVKMEDHFRYKKYFKFSLRDAWILKMQKNICQNSMGGLPPTCQTLVYDNGKQIVLCIKQTAKNRTQNESIDNLYDALKRRNLDCFKSCSSWTWVWEFMDGNYGDWYNNFIKKKSPTLRTIEILTQVNNSQKSDKQNS